MERNKDCIVSIGIVEFITINGWNPNAREKNNLYFKFKKLKIKKIDMIDRSHRV